MFQIKNRKVLVLQAEAKINEFRLRKRYLTLLVFFGLCFSVLMCRLFVLQVLMHSEYSEKAKDNIESETTLKAGRGVIYDRNMVPLTSNITTYRIFVSPRDVQGEEEAEVIASGLSEILDVDYETALSGIKNNKTRDRTIKKNATEEQQKAVLEFVIEKNLSHCVHSEAVTSRYYPFGELAAHVIGFVGTDGGLLGIESYYDSYLKGQDGVYITQKNASGERLPDSKDTYIKAVDGADVILTIDITVQALLESRLKEAYHDSNAQNRVTGVVTDPETGEILAMATYPSFDLNNPYQLNDFYLAKLADSGLMPGTEEYTAKRNELLYEMWNNKAVSTLYEPGSTFKILTTSIALQEKVTTVNEGFFCSGSLKVDGYGTPIRCHKREGHGSLNFAEALQKSCNPTMIKLAQRVGNTKFMEYFRNLGFTGKTGIDLPGEALGIFHAEENFNNVELSVYSFGQTFKTTPLQQITAISAVANGGDVLKPFIVREIREKSGETVYSGTVKVQKKVFDEEICQTISQILIDGVDGDGGAKNAAVAGYDIAAKTGTSQVRDIRDENGNSYLYVGSCVGYSLSDEASVAVIIVVDQPKCQNYYGSTVAAPYVGSFFEDVLPYLGVEPEYTEEEEAKLNATVGNYIDMTVNETKNAVNKLGLKVTVIGTGEKVVSQMPEAGSKISKTGGTVIIYTGGETEKTGEVPKVEGKIATEAIRDLINAGYNVKIEGVTDYEKGVGATVIKQDIVGKGIEKGTVITIRLRYLDVKE